MPQFCSTKKDDSLHILLLQISLIFGEVHELVCLVGILELDLFLLPGVREYAFPFLVN